MLFAFIPNYFYPPPHSQCFLHLNLNQFVHLFYAIKQSSGRCKIIGGPLLSRQGPLSEGFTFLSDYNWTFYCKTLLWILPCNANPNVPEKWDHIFTPGSQNNCIMCVGEVGILKKSNVILHWKENKYVHILSFPRLNHYYAVHSIKQTKLFQQHY